MTESDRKTIDDSISDMKKSGLDYFIIDCVRNGMTLAIEAKNGLPDNEKISTLAESHVLLLKAWVRFMYLVRGDINDLKRNPLLNPQNKFERIVRVVSPIAWPCSVVAVVAMLSGHFRELIMIARIFVGSAP